MRNLPNIRRAGRDRSSWRDRAPVYQNFSYFNPSASVQSSDHPRRYVLIIDDDPVFALLASETLEQAGFTAKVASNTHAALALFEKDQPDVVLLDVELPGSNGFTICAKLRAMSPDHDVPIIMVPAHDATESIAHAYEAGATDFIHKPVLWPTLPHRIGFIFRAQDSMRGITARET